jgi:hypothetical protein
MKPLARRDQLIIEDLVGECVVYDSKNKKAHNLNATLTWIWRQCDGSTDLEEIAMRFEREFGYPDSFDIVLSGIEQLQAAELLVSTVADAALPASSTGPGISRRSVVVAGSALVPSITSILVPTAAAAKSKPDKKPKK